MIDTEHTAHTADRIFSVHMVHVRWDPRARRDLEVIDGGEVPLRAVEPGVWQGTLFSYGTLGNGLVAQLAIRSAPNSNPHLLRDGVAPTRMKQLVSRADGPWWVEDDEWSRSRKFFGFQSGRGVGMIEVLVGEQRCRLRVLPDGFTEEEIDDLFDSYEDAIQLILKTDSSTFIPLDWEPNDKIETLVRQFLAAANRAIDKPVRGLVRGATLVRSDRVRPTLETTVAEAKRPETRIIAARHLVESLDIPENGYVLHCLNRIHSRLRLAIARATRARRTARMVSASIQERLDREFGTSELPAGELRVKIDLDRYERALRNDRKRIERIREYLVCRTAIPDGTVRELTFTVKKPGSGGRFYVTLPDNSEAVLQFPITWKVEEQRIQGRYCLSARMVQTRPTPDEESYGARSRLVIHQVLDIRDLGLEEQEARFERLQNSHGFFTPRREDQEKFRSYFQARLSDRAKENRRFKDADKVAIRWRTLESLTRLAICRLSGVRAHPRLPQSIVFNLNPSYRAVVRFYAEIATLWNLEHAVQHEYDGCIPRGVARASEVYERWCLVELLNMLTSQFGFAAPDKRDWIDRLAASLENDRRFRATLALTLDNPRWNVECKLEYEPRVDNPTGSDGSFPDIRLTITVGGTAKPPDRPGSSRFLLDAKFRKFWHSLPKDCRHSRATSTISEVLKETVEKYGKSGSGTYVLHPSPGAIPDPGLLSSWADSSTYGGSAIFDWEETPPSHGHGAVLLRPGRHRDELRRLVIMMMHASGFYSFCPGCGGKVTLFDDQKNYQKRGVGFYGECREPGCEMNGIPTVVTQCLACKRRLAKLGPYWTYHDFAYEPGYNMVCPDCGTSLSPRNDRHPIAEF